VQFALTLTSRRSDAALASRLVKRPRLRTSIMFSTAQMAMRTPRSGGSKPPVAWAPADAVQSNSWLVK
jgi:hypothetical protein